MVGDDDTLDPEAVRRVKERADSVARVMDDERDSHLLVGQ